MSKTYSDYEYNKVEKQYPHHPLKVGLEETEWVDVECLGHYLKEMWLNKSPEEVGEDVYNAVVAIYGAIVCWQRTFDLDELASEKYGTLIKSTSMKWSGASHHD